MKPEKKIIPEKWCGCGYHCGVAEDEGHNQAIDAYEEWIKSVLESQDVRLKLSESFLKRRPFELHEALRATDEILAFLKEKMIGGSDG